MACCCKQRAGCSELRSTHAQGGRLACAQETRLPSVHLFTKALVFKLLIPSCCVSRVQVPQASPHWHVSAHHPRAA